MASKETPGSGIIAIRCDQLFAFLRGAENKKLADRLRLMAPLQRGSAYFRPQEHSVAERPGWQTRGSRQRRGGSWLTAVTLFDYAQIKPIIEYTAKGDAAKAFCRGSGCHDFLSQGSRSVFFEGLGKLKLHYPEQFANVHFLEINPTASLKKLPYVKSSIGGRLPWLDTSVSTAAVKALLVAFDFSQPINTYYTQPLCPICPVGQALRENIGQLKQTGHAKWQEVDLNADVGDWPRDSCTWKKSSGGLGQSKGTPVGGKSNANDPARIFRI